MAGYFVLSALACQAFRDNNIRIILVGIFIIGVGIEIIQYVLPLRTFNIYDLLANLIGVFLVVMINLFYQRKESKYGKC